MSNPIKILVVDDNAAFRSSFCRMLAQLPQVCKIVEVADGENAIQQVKQWIPDLIFMDITMPLLDGIETTHQILKEHPTLKITMLTVHANQALLNKSIKLGACGYLVKNSIHEELAQAVEIILMGETYVSQTLRSELNFLVQKEKTRRKSR